MMCKNRDNPKTFCCTLKKGHKGNHIAHRDKRHRKQDIITTWKNEDE